MSKRRNKIDPESLFEEIAHHQQQRQNNIDQTVIPVLQREEIPTPDDVRELINSCVGDKRDEILRHHIYWKERQLKLGLDSLFCAAHQAYVDICRHDAALGALARGEKFQDHVDHTIGYAAQKDMVAYCSLASGIRDTIGKIKKQRKDIEHKIGKIEQDTFESDISEFVRKLRNNLLHGDVVVPQWNITHEFQRQISFGTMTYTAKELMNFGNWNQKSKKYISSFDDGTISLSAVVRDHFKSLNQLNRKMADLFARNVLESEIDFFDIEDSHKRKTRRQWVKILISQIGKGKDPYEYLHRFFDPETVREIFRLPRNSREQVDFIINSMISEIDCDADLRDLLFDKFEVINHPENV